MAGGTAALSEAGFAGLGGIFGIVGDGAGVDGNVREGAGDYAERDGQGDAVTANSGTDHRGAQERG